MPEKTPVPKIQIPNVFLNGNFRWDSIIEIRDSASDFFKSPCLYLQPSSCLLFMVLVAVMRDVIRHLIVAAFFLNFSTP